MTIYIVVEDYNTGYDYNDTKNVLATTDKQKAIDTMRELNKKTERSYSYWIDAWQDDKQLDIDIR